MTKKTRFDPQSIIDAQVRVIDEQISEIERRMKPYEKLNEAKQKLLASRRALLGAGPRTTGGTTTRLTIDDLVAYVKEHPGITPSEAAQHFGTTQSVVSSHFYRNSKRFVKKDDGYWVRDPKSGLNTADDIEENDDEDEEE